MGTFSTELKRGNLARMDIYEIRKTNLLRLIGTQRKGACAEKWGMSPAHLSQILSERTNKNLGDDVARRIEIAEGRPRGWLDNVNFEDFHIQEESPRYSVDTNVEPAPGPVRYYEYPEISWVQAGMPVEAVELSNIATCEMHPSDAWAGEHGFWLKVRGPSMTSQGGISFIEGMVILVAPGFDVEPGNYVVAKLVDTHEATFKQYIWDSGKAYLKPLNPAFPTVEVDDSWVIVGKVVDAKWPRAVLG